jgi:MerR family redox-sensitive transcriptional activator SoxR
VTVADTLSIGEVARASGFNSSAIRFYERHGILPEPNRVSGKRRYTSAVLERLTVLDGAKQAGFSLDDIRVLFDATDNGAPAHAELKELAQRKLPEIEALIARAEEVKSWLEAAGDCSCDTLTECTLFDHGLSETSCGEGCQSG